MWRKKGGRGCCLQKSAGCFQFNAKRAPPSAVPESVREPSPDARKTKKMLDHTMVNLPEHASSAFVAEPSELMLDHAWWDAVGERSTPSCYQSIPLSHSLHRCALLLLVLQCY